jgi:shikimate dehydrogenase
MNPPGRMDRRHLPDGRTRVLGIVGEPLAHSLSPSLHTAVLRFLDRNLIYLPFSVSGDRLGAFLQLAPELGILGLNVTTPFKERVWSLVRSGDLETERTGMVNTIQFRPEGATGWGTDGAGILSWLEAANLVELPFGVLGFGPSARSLVYRALHLGRAPRVILTHRPEQVGKTLNSWGASERIVRSWDDPDTAWAGKSPGLWISALPPAVSPLPAFFWNELSEGAILLDLNYGSGRSDLAEEARARGHAAADGIGPLCHQAALSLSGWLGMDVPAALFYRALDRSGRSLHPRL